MKPNDLKLPYAFCDRHPCIKDGVFYVPARFDLHQQFSFPLWEGVFPLNQPVYLEYCSGNGKWIARRALQDPDSNYVAVDIRFDRVRKIWSKIGNDKIPNLFCVYGDGFTLAKHYVKDHSVDEIFINFPDPWPKLRHMKHRLMKVPFIQEQQRILKPGGKITFVTDDVDYLNWTIANFRKVAEFEFCHEEPHYTFDIASYGSSYFEELWLSKGRKIYYLEVGKR